MPQDQEQNPTIASTAGGISKVAHDEADGARKVFSEATADLSDKASSFAGEAKDAVLEKVEGAKEGLSGSLKAFGEALRAAGDHLAQGQPSASRIVTEAADGLERLSGSLENKPLSEVIEEVRSFGHNNAGGLFAGSVVAGLALGRLLKSGNANAVPPTAAAETEQGKRSDAVQDAASRQIAGAEQ